MNKKNINDKFQYLSLVLVLSFFIFHNIYLVFCGISVAVYMINKKFINNLFNFDVVKLSNEEKGKNFDIITEETRNYNSQKDDTLISLVEAIEESGFIPSIDENDSNKAA